MVTLDDVRSLAIGLPRSTEAVVRRRLKFRVGRIVYLAFSADESVMGFAFPREWRDVLVNSDTAKFSLPSQADLPYNWVHVRFAALDATEMRELGLAAWRMGVPKSGAADYDARITS